jgi:hypothetical protein
MTSPRFDQAARTSSRITAWRVARWLLPSVAALLAPQLAQAQVPNADVRNTCQIAASVMVRLMGGTTMEQSLSGCLDSENAARAQIVKDWNTYSAADRTQCLQPNFYLPSYVEWLTCLEMERDVRRLRSERGEPTITTSGVTTLPVIPPKVSW